jgi:hypothetical protein
MDLASAIHVWWRDRNVCLEFSPIKFDDEFDDPRHKGRVDGAAAVHKETRARAIL